jgi:competence protein ComEC
MLYNFFSLPGYMPLLFIALGIVVFSATQVFKKRIHLFYFPAWVGFSLFCFFIGLGIGSNAFYQQDYNPLKMKQGGYGYYLVQVRAQPKIKPRSVGFKAKILGLQKDTSFIPQQAHAMLYLEKSSAAKSLNYGDRLWVNTKISALQAPVNPGEFNYKGYLNLKGINWQGYAKSENWQLTGTDTKGSLVKWAHNIQKYLSQVIDQWQFKAAEKAVAKALLLGYKDEIDKDLLGAYSSAGAMHVLAVSGLHVGIIYLMLSRALNFLKDRNWQKFTKLIVLMACLWVYALVTGLSASVVRAATMFSFVAVGQILNRNTSIYNTIIVSAFFLLLIKPTYLFEVGFQLSYAAVFGIVWLQPKLEKSINPPPTKILRGLWAIITVSVAAQLATFPLGLYYFHQFPVLFLLSNVLVIPLVTAILYYGVALLLISATGWISFLALEHSSPAEWLYGLLQQLYNGSTELSTLNIEFVFTTLVSPLDALLKLLNISVDFVEQQGYLISEITLTRLDLSLIYLIIILACHWLLRGKLRRLQTAMALAIFFLGLQYYENYQLQKGFKITGYIADQGEAWGIYNGHRGTFVAPKALLENKPALTFRVKHHWWQLNLDSLSKITMASLRAEQEQLAAVLEGGKLISYGEKGLGADLWLVMNKTHIPQDKQVKEAVLVNNLTPKRFQKWQAYTLTHQLNLVVIDSLENRTYKWN